MATFSFKSSGKTQTQTNVETAVVTSPPVGIKTPLRLGTNDIFETNSALSDQVHDNLRNLLLTNWGDRLGLYDFGANLRPLTTELVEQSDFDAAAIDNIRTAVARWMPFVDLEDFSSVTDRIENRNTAIIKVTITYNVPSLNVKQRCLEILLYVI